jgi:hypothetical protein
MKLTITKQISAYTCVLACLESILTDLNMPITQQDLINKYPQLCHKGEAIEGAFDFNKDNFDLVANELNFQWHQSDTFEPPNENEAYLILTTEGDKHCVRAVLQKSPSSFWVMDPNANRVISHAALFEFDFEKEKDRKPLLIKIAKAETGH